MKKVRYTFHMAEEHKRIIEGIYREKDIASAQLIGSALDNFLVSTGRLAKPIFQPIDPESLRPKESEKR